MAARDFHLVGPYGVIYREMMKHDETWTPPEIGDEEFDDDESVVISEEGLDPYEQLDDDIPFYEISLEGPAGTGKTFFEGVLLEDLHSRYPNLRSCVLRKTRVSLTDSWMQVFEEDVLGPDHPILARKINRANRTEYKWSAVKNVRGAVTRLAGMDNPTRLFSTQYDVIIVVEAIELSEDEYESLFRAMRNKGAPFKAVICDTNPGNIFHWLNIRPDQENKRMIRVVTKHRHNPYYFDPFKKRWTKAGRQYMQILNQLSGVMRVRLLEGMWCAATGVIFEHYNPDVHLFDPGDPLEDEYNELKHRPWGRNLPRFSHFIGGIDFGWHDCKVLQIWGVTFEKDMYLVAEWYGTHVPLETLVEWVVEANDEFTPARIVADHEPDMIEFVNDKLGWRGGRDCGNLVVPAQKGPGSLKAGLELMMDLFANNPAAPGRKPKIFICTNAKRYHCQELADKKRPQGMADELPGYCWAEQKDGSDPKEEPDPGSIDHGIDSGRYVITEEWKTDFRQYKRRFTVAEVFSGHPDVEMTDTEFEDFVRQYVDEE